MVCFETEPRRSQSPVTSVGQFNYHYRLASHPYHDTKPFLALEQPLFGLCCRTKPFPKPQSSRIFPSCSGGKALLAPWASWCYCSKPYCATYHSSDLGDERAPVKAFFPTPEAPTTGEFPHGPPPGGPFSAGADMACPGPSICVRLKPTITRGVRGEKGVTRFSSATSGP